VENSIFPIVLNEEIAPGYFMISVDAAPIAEAAVPGQFVMFRISRDSFDPLLRRPISIMSVSKSGRVDFLYKVVGRGTKILAAIRPGAAIDLLGPVGTGFRLPKQEQTALLVAGGIGVPPLYFLAARLIQMGHVKIHAFLGAGTNRELLCREELKNLKIIPDLATDDGTTGHRGFVTELLTKYLEVNRARNAVIYACGPSPMLAEVSRIAARASLSAQLSLEAQMACGVGACLGCVIETSSGQKRVCQDGPVFDAETLRNWM
jgi:dihydroorotate dehydrogenase electron transfer subunit